MAEEERISDIITDINNLQFGDDIKKDKILFSVRLLLSNLPNENIYLDELQSINFFEPIFRDVFSGDNNAYYESLDRQAWEKGKQRLVNLLEEVKRSFANTRPSTVEPVGEKINGANLNKPLDTTTKGIIDDALSILKKELKEDRPNIKTIKQNFDILLKYGTGRDDTFDELLPFVKPFLKMKKESDS
jgi:hypothetical protein